MMTDGVEIMNQDMEAFFDQLAPNWDPAPDKYELREELAARMNISPNSVIADIGCGTGVMFEHLLKTDPAKIIAVDISGEMLRSAKARFGDSRIEYIHDNFLNAALPLSDAVIFFNSYPHFQDKSAVAKKAAQVLKIGGALIIAHSMSKSEINNRHKGESVSKLSVTLESAEVEADKFKPFFTLDSLIDNERMYFIKMVRVKI